MGFKEDFQYYHDVSNGDLEAYLRPCVNQIHERAEELGLEFDGYYTTIREKVKKTSIQVESDFFVNDDRRTLYILCASLCSEEIMEMLHEALKRTPYFPISREAICARINYFGKSGISFLPSLAE